MAYSLVMEVKSLGNKAAEGKTAVRLDEGLSEAETDLFSTSGPQKLANLV